MSNDAGKNTDDTRSQDEDGPDSIGHTQIPEESASSESELSMSAQVEKRESDGSQGD